MRRRLYGQEPNPILSATETRSGRIPGRIRLFPVTRVCRRRIESDYRTPEGPRGLDTPRCAWCQLEPNHWVSHLILKTRCSKNLDELEPRYGIEP
jgi:hypothetical protein